ncbi:MAG: UDP-N-acetylmuramoyl-L-alanyl-D-glutamate--2,6-diaminopimelate ligase [Gemmatimonadales bacterium]|nr:MAG: UDP-N-acetylmuramoyl-L-alanyl-D-glutamate--2,6-diaminopimelate ligase [Gemmatimonadales bacterium]
MMAAAAISLGRVLDVLRRHELLVELHGPEDVAISGVSQDSRSVKPGDLFLAWKGTEMDAHDFVRAAEDGGAAAAVVERVVDGAALPQIRVSNGRRAAAIVAMEVLGSPGSGFLLTAITGTNGKTTTALLTRYLLGADEPSVALGTLGLVGADGEVREGQGGLTTPGPVELARLFQQLAAEGVRRVTMEASSHALDQHRLDGIRPDVAVFTNLTRDHLDYHGTFEAYREAKLRLFELLADDGTAVVHAGDPSWSDLLPRAARLRRVYIDASTHPEPKWPEGEILPDLVAQGLLLSGTGSRFLLTESGDSVTVTLPLLGRFNVENALCAAGVARAAGLSLAEIAERLREVPSPPGRLELIARRPVPVVLDYAHTPDALARALETLRPLYSGRLIVVFGAGGDRDREKRPEMGRVASNGADLPIVTSDNPRTEDPEAIVDQIVAGVSEPFRRIVDRREAIEAALREARPGDVVLLAGKGHERYQVVGTERRPFDEREIVREAVDRLGAA